MTESKERTFYSVISGMFFAIVLLLLANYLIYSDIYCKVSQINKVVVTEYIKKADSLEKKQIFNDAKLNKFYFDLLDSLKKENKSLQTKLKSKENYINKIEIKNDTTEPKIKPLPLKNSNFKYSTEGVIE